MLLYLTLDHHLLSQEVASVLWTVAAGPGSAEPPRAAVNLALAPPSETRAAIEYGPPAPPVSLK